MTDMNFIDILVRHLEVLSGKWVIPILLTIDKKGDRFTPLQNRLGITPGRLSDNLQKLKNLGLIHHLEPLERRHPLLPEYQLTSKGTLYRELSMKVESLSLQLDTRIIIEKKWRLSVMLLIYRGDHKFIEIKKALNNVTSKTLSSCLTELQEINYVTKNVIKLTPIEVEYRLNKDLIKDIAVFLKSIQDVLIRLSKEV